ncbi:MAG TPA: hypothetical protein DCS93_44605, partial [Microscillaceae bacterium]|nr:hypothetical protein [Microscillaceae bacterium]
MNIDFDDQLLLEWQQEKQRLRQQVNQWIFLLTIFLYPATLIDYSAVKPEETTFFIGTRLLPSLIIAIAWLGVYLWKKPNQAVLYLLVVCVLAASTYRPIPGDMGNFVFTNACCLILMSALPLIDIRISLALFIYLLIINIGAYIIFYADTVPLPQSGLVFTASLGVMFVIVSKFRYEIARRNFLQSKQLSAQNAQINEQKQELQFLNHSLQEKNHLLLESLSYAQNIQTLLLPRIQDIQKSLPKSFVLFKPRNQVSGDFYWYTQTSPSPKANIILIVMDCTGHGVPGALISMIGESLLKQIVLKEKVHAPHQILHRLHQEIRLTLRQNESNNRDGMDMGIVRINLEDQTLHYAGAHNHLIYFQEEEMHQVKGDLYSIGGEQREIERMFTNHTIDISRPTTFYLFSDGYQDQFG